MSSGPGLSTHVKEWGTKGTSCPTQWHGQSSAPLQDLPPSSEEFMATHTHAGHLRWDLTLSF